MTDTEQRIVYVAYTNSDRTEGRGHDIPIAHCELEATAIRLAKGRYVQGSDGPVRPVTLVKHGDRWYMPTAAINIIGPSEEDASAQARKDAKAEALQKAKALGLSEADLKALGVKE